MAGSERCRFFFVSEACSSLTVRDSDRKAASIHAVEEDTWLHPSLFRWLGDFHHAKARLILLANILFETWPITTLRHNCFELAQELTAITHAQREGILPLKERFELCSSRWMKHYRLGPSLSSA